MPPATRKRDPRLHPVADVQPVTRRFRYDFTRQGGAIGAIALTDKDGKALSLPPNAIVTRVYTDVLTNLASGGAATVALGITGSTASFKAATAYNDAAYVGVDPQAAALPVKVPADGANVLATVAAAALTGGVADVIVEFIPPNVKNA